MQHKQAHQTLTQLGFCIAEDVLADIHRQAPSPGDFLVSLEKLLQEEVDERSHRNLARRLKNGKLGTMSPIDKFDWSYPLKIEKETYKSLMSLDFIRQSENVLFRGPSGVGKTTLAQNLGLKAIQAGLNVRLETLSSIMFNVLKREESLPAIERRLKAYSRPSILIIDEVGYLQNDARTADILFSIINSRHKKASTIITTNLPFKEWGRMFGDGGSLTAAIDRFSEYCHVMDIEGASWRQRKDRKTKNTQSQSTKSSKASRKQAALFEDPSLKIALPDGITLA